MGQQHPAEAGEVDARPGENDENLIGKIGRVTVPIPLNGPGEVMLAVRGGTEAYAAWADEQIPKHRQIVVVEERSPRSVTVTPLPQSIFP